MGGHLALNRRLTLAGYFIIDPKATHTFSNLFLPSGNAYANRKVTSGWAIKGLPGECVDSLKIRYKTTP
jgi:hypothetical protein